MLECVVCGRIVNLELNPHGADSWVFTFIGPLCAFCGGTERVDILEEAQDGKDDEDREYPNG